MSLVRPPPVPTTLALALSSALLPPAPAWAQQAAAGAAVTLERVDVTGHYDNAVGSSDAASQGRFGQQLIEERPLLRPGQLLEYVPGLVVTQHSGSGKANQYFLRGFDADHGTDVEARVAGVPINELSNVHGQGYIDLNFVIPEVVRRISASKGPFLLDQGNFANAGTVRFELGVDRETRGNRVSYEFGSTIRHRGVFVYAPKHLPKETLA